MSKDKKKKYMDDGHTIVSMDGVHDPVRKNIFATSKKDRTSGVNLDKKERRAMIKAAFATYFPLLLGVILCFAVALLVIFLWLS